jgi:hypothetical protein
MTLYAGWAADMMMPMSRNSETADRAAHPLTDVGVMDTIARRVSCRAYKADPVPEGHPKIDWGESRHSNRKGISELVQWL